jgi:hypothetical protein
MLKKQTKNKEEKKEEKILPCAKFRSGALEGTVWEREVKLDKGKFADYNFTLQRSYKDKEKEWQKTNSMRKRDLSGLHAILSKIEEYLMIDEDEETEDATSKDDDEEE